MKLYSQLQEKYPARVAVRSLAATVVGQAADSIIFFSLAFDGLISNSYLWQAMLIGFLIKSLLGVISIPFLYSSYTVRREPEDGILTMAHMKEDIGGRRMSI